jgi:hypothetical protein
VQKIALGAATTLIIAVILILLIRTEVAGGWTMGLLISAAIISIASLLVDERRPVHPHGFVTRITPWAEQINRLELMGSLFKSPIR